MPHITIKMKVNALVPNGENSMLKANKNEVVSMDILYAENLINKGQAEKVYRLPDRRFQEI